MMTLALIALGAYALLTVLFISWLALAARRPVPEIDNVIPSPWERKEDPVPYDKVA